jgi:hypothetical protein
MNSETTYDRMFDWLGSALEEPEIDSFKPAYDGFKCLALFYFIETDQNVTYEQFVLDVVARVYEEDGDEDYLNPICQPFDLGKLIYIDDDLKEFVESIVKVGQTPCGHLVKPMKLQYLCEALHYAMNFHSNYFPEHLLER